MAGEVSFLANIWFRSNASLMLGSWRDPQYEEPS